MPLTFDMSGLRQIDQAAWQVETTGDIVMAHYFDLVPDLPASLDDLRVLRQRLAVAVSGAGCLVEADVVVIDSVPAVHQIIKVRSRTSQPARCS